MNDLETLNFGIDEPETPRKSGRVKRITEESSGEGTGYIDIGKDRYHFKQSDCRPNVWQKLKTDTWVSFVAGSGEDGSGAPIKTAADINIVEMLVD